MSKNIQHLNYLFMPLLAGIPVSYAQIVINKPIEPKESSSSARAKYRVFFGICL